MNVAEVNLTGQTAVATGASRGIGREMALYLARAGAHVILMARDESLLEKAVGEIRAVGGKAEAITVDVAEPPSVKTAFAKAEKMTGASKDDLEAMVADANRIVDEDLHTLRLKQ